MEMAKRRKPRVSADQSPGEDPLKVLEIRPISSWPWPRIVGGVLMERAMGHADDVFFDFWSIAQQGLPLMKIPYGRTDVVRNRMAMELLKSNFTHLLMLDIDHKHLWSIVQRLARWVVADPKKLVVGGLNFRRGAPYDPCCFLEGADGKLYPPAEWEQGLIRMDAIGTGSVLISREVFERIPPPWFFNDYSRAWEDEWPGEDIGFSKLCRENGIELWVDTTTTSPHMIDAYVDESSFRQYLADHEGKVVDIETFQAAQEAVQEAQA
jgi:hypothetical protein